MNACPLWAMGVTDVPEYSLETWSKSSLWQGLEETYGKGWLCGQKP